MTCTEADNVFITDKTLEIKHVDFEKSFAGKIIIVTPDVGKWLRNQLNPKACSFVVVAPEENSLLDKLLNNFENPPFDLGTKRSDTDDTREIITKRFVVYFQSG